MMSEMKEVRIIVITGYGINCEAETAAAFNMAGAKSDIVHLNDIFNCRVSLNEYDLLAIPGGFSFGDDLGSGRVLANKMKYKKLSSGRFFFDEIIDFIDQGGYIIGICNGFQVLVKMGLLPNLNGKFVQEVTLTSNDRGVFEDRWCRLAVNPQNTSEFFNGIDSIDLPVRHGEGKFVAASKEVMQKIMNNSLIVLQYCDENGKPTQDYPMNPNGSEMSVAALTDIKGQILGIMPHPEAYLSLYNHPDWPHLKRMDSKITEEGDGLGIFRNMVKTIRKYGNETRSPA